MRLARYTVKAEYIPGKYLVVADTLSRLQPKEISEGLVANLDEEVASFVDCAVANHQGTQSTLQRIKIDQKKEKSIAEAIIKTKNGWLDEDRIHTFYAARGDLSISNEEILLYRNRLVIPTSMRREMLKKTHGTAHLSLTKCRQRIKESLWWPGISADLSNWIERCNFCQIHKRKQRAEPLNPSTLPDRPWQKLAMDLFEFDSQKYLITVDCFSRWIEVDPLKSTSSKAVIDKLDQHFSRFGIPEVIRSDGGPQFASHEFESFCRSNDIYHSLSAPYHPQGNGAAERAVQTAKRLVKTENLTEALKDYRSTALEVTGYAPCQLLMGRMIKTLLPLADDALTPQWPNFEEVKKTDAAAKEKYAVNFNRRHGARKLPDIQPNAKVRVRKGNEKKWSDPLSIEKKISSTRYAVRNRRHLQLCPAASRKFHEAREQSDLVRAPPEVPHQSMLQVPRLRPAPVPAPRPAPAVRPALIPPPGTSTVTRSGRLVKPVQRYGSFICNV